MLNAKINRIASRFVEHFNITDMNFQLIIADDLYEAQKAFGFNDTEVKSIDEATARANWKNVAACMKYPRIMSDPFTLLFKRPYLERVTDAELYRLVFHEMTHMCDYRDYARIHNIKSYAELFSDPNAVLFQQWSEYHAERRGYAAWMRHRYGVHLKYAEFKQSILEQETVNNMQLYSRQYTNTAEYGSSRQVYFTMHLISHLSILCQYMPLQMTRILNEKPFNYKGLDWIKKLMYIFNEYPEIDSMDPHFMDIARVVAEGLAIAPEERWIEQESEYKIPIEKVRNLNLTFNM